MLSIGEFARFGGVSVRTLRYYEEVRLLLPAEVDGRTGYRSYDAHQLARLHRITSLKDLGLSLEQLRPLLEEVTVGELHDMLLAKHNELQQQITDHQALVTRIENRMRYIEEEDA